MPFFSNVLNAHQTKLQDYFIRSFHTVFFFLITSMLESRAQPVRLRKKRWCKFLGKNQLAVLKLSSHKKGRNTIGQLRPCSTH